MRYALFLLPCIIFYSCNEVKKSNKKEDGKVEQLNDSSLSENDTTLGLSKNKKELLSQLLNASPKIELPFYWDANSTYKTVDVKEYQELLPNLSLIGYFRVHNFYAFIQLIPADEMIPNLTILDSVGETIDSETIVIGRCHGDCSYECREFTRIGTDLNIYSLFSSVYQECDGTGDIVAGEAEASILEATGK